MEVHVSEEMDYTDRLVHEDAVRDSVAVLTYGEWWVRVTTPYSEEWVEEIKAAIRPRSRRWVPEGRYWLFRDSPHLIEKVIAASAAQGWAVREEWPDGRRRTTYPNGEAVEEKQEDLFDGY